MNLDSRGIAVPLSDRHRALTDTLNITLLMGRESGQGAAACVLYVLRETAQALRDLI